MIEMTFERFKEWLSGTPAIEVDYQYVIYPPHEDDGEMEFKEDESQEEPYFTITKDWHFLLHDGMMSVYSPDKDDDHDILRLGYKDSFDSYSDVYAENNGEKCPNPSCGSTRIDQTSELDHCGNRIYQGCRCVNCGKEWNDHYTLTGMSEVEDLDA